MSVTPLLRLVDPSVRKSLMSKLGQLEKATTALPARAPSRHVEGDRAPGDEGRVQLIEAVSGQVSAEDLVRLPLLGVEAQRHGATGVEDDAAGVGQEAVDDQRRGVVRRRDAVDVGKSDRGHRRLTGTGTGSRRASHRIRDVDGDIEVGADGRHPIASWSR